MFRSLLAHVQFLQLRKSMQIWGVKISHPLFAINKVIIRLHEFSHIGMVLLLNSR